MGCASVCASVNIYICASGQMHSSAGSLLAFNVLFFRIKVKSRLKHG